MAERSGDKYSNMIVKTITASSANTLTYDEISLGLSLFDKVGLLVQRIEYFIRSGPLGEMTTAADEIQLALVTSNAPSTLIPSDASVIHQMKFLRIELGTSASAALVLVPMIFDFSNLAGGGILITPRPLYAAVKTTGLASAAVADIRIYFTVIKLSGEDYFELLESRHYFGQ